MLSIKINIIYFALIIIFVEIQSLLQLSKSDNNSIKIADTAIRNTVNKLFNTLKIQNINQNPRLKQFYTIHNYFVSMTLTDCNNVENIIGLSRVNEIENNTQHLITIINEAFMDSDKSSETKGYNIFVAKHIQTVIAKLKYLKEKYVSERKTPTNGDIFNYTNKNDQTLLYREYEKFAGSIEETNEEENSTSYSDFWKPSGRRIFEGSRTSIKNYPFLASIQFFKKFQCAGAIIKDDLVITSAACLQLAWNNRFFRENPAFITVQIGSNYYEYDGDNIAVLEIYFHPSYEPKTLQNNLAIMRLERKINFKKSRRTKKIDIDRNPYPFAGYSKITIVGWGAIDDNNIIYDVLRNKITFAELDFYPLKECIEHYTSDYVTMKNFCAGFLSKGGGACNRDAGGPAVTEGILLGVISYGSAMCGAADSPTVFTKLGFYADWIDSIIDQDVQSLKKRTTTTAPIYMPIVMKIVTTTPLTVTPMGTIPALPDFEGVDALRTVREQDLYEILPSIFSSNEVRLLYGKQESDSKEVERTSLEISKKQNESEVNITPTETKSNFPQQQLDEDTSFGTSVETAIESVTSMAAIEKSSNSTKDAIMDSIENLDIDKFLDAIINYKDEVLTDDSNESNNNIINAEKNHKTSTTYTFTINHISSTETDEEGLSIL